MGLGVGAVTDGFASSPKLASLPVAGRARGCREQGGHHRRSQATRTRCPFRPRLFRAECLEMETDRSRGGECGAVSRG